MPFNSQPVPMYIINFNPKNNHGGLETLNSQFHLLKFKTNCLGAKTFQFDGHDAIREVNKSTQKLSIRRFPSKWNEKVSENQIVY